MDSIRVAQGKPPHQKQQSQSPQKVIVRKFGGTSVGSIERIESVADRIACDERNRSIVVVSAMSGETNRLVALANQIDPAERGPAYDMLLASGEQVSVALLAMALSKRGLQAQPFLAYQLGIQTDMVFSKARILAIDSAKLQALLDRGITPVIAGFQGVTKDWKLTTLGRGGSDTTAVAIAAALGLDECEIYTDVSQVFTADPRIVPDAKPIPILSFEDMMEMAHLGSKVLHPRSVEIAAKFGIRIHLRSSFSNEPGTWIQSKESNMENPAVSAVTHEAKVALFELSPVPFETQFLSVLFTQLKNAGIGVDIISQIERGRGVAFSVSSDDVEPTKTTLKKFLDPKVDIQIREDVSKLSIVGVGMATHPGVAATFFTALTNVKSPLYLVTTSDIKISVLINRSQLEIAAQQLHTAFELEK